MLHYRIVDGQFEIDDAFEGNGYSGEGLTFAEGRNNIGMVNVQGVGPIPPGRYRVMPSRTSTKLGPLTFDLVPMPDTETFGRSLFRIHGNNKANNASHGCIILGPRIRAAIDAVISHPAANDDYNILEVIAA